MGLYLKALVVTLLLMEITTLVVLTSVWAILSELQVPPHAITIAVVLSGFLLIFPGLAVFRRAVRSERNMALDAQEGPFDPLPKPDPGNPPNLVGKVQPHAPSPAARPPSRHTRPPPGNRR